MTRPTREALIGKMVESGFPERHCSTIGACKGKEWLAKYKTVFSWMAPRPGFIMALLGNRGTGKTQMACSLSFSLVQASPFMGIRYARATEIAADVRSTFRSKSESEESVLDFYRSVDLLVVDQLGVRGGTDFEGSTLATIFDARYSDSNQKTILISNDAPEAFKNAVGADVWDRIVETGVVVDFKWKSLRASADDVR